jgi:hypothetical protein
MVMHPVCPTQNLIFKNTGGKDITTEFENCIPALGGTNTNGYKSLSVI